MNLALTRAAIAAFAADAQADVRPDAARGFDSTAVRVARAFAVAAPDLARNPRLLKYVTEAQIQRIALPFMPRLARGVASVMSAIPMPRAIPATEAEEQQWVRSAGRRMAVGMDRIQCDRDDGAERISRLASGPIRVAPGDRGQWPSDAVLRPPVPRQQLCRTVVAEYQARDNERRLSAASPRCHRFVAAPITIIRDEDQRK